MHPLPANSSGCSCPVTNASSNEVLLFCTVLPDSFDTVTERGFMKNEGLFGLGLYFMDNVTKGASCVSRCAVCF